MLAAIIFAATSSIGLCLSKSGFISVTSIAKTLGSDQNAFNNLTASCSDNPPCTGVPVPEEILGSKLSTSKET